MSLDALLSERLNAATVTVRYGTAVAGATAGSAKVTVSIEGVSLSLPRFAGGPAIGTGHRVAVLIDPEGLALVLGSFAP